MKENKPRKQIKNEINKEGARGTADINDRMEVDPRKTTYTPAPNRYELMVEERKEVKWDRNENKLKNTYPGNSRHNKSFVKAEAEQEFLDSPTETEMDTEIKKERETLEQKEDTEE